MLARRLLIAGGGASLTPPGGGFEVFTLLTADEGGWTWFNDPRAIYSGGKTFFGYISGDGHVRAAQYVHSTATVSTPAELYPPGVFEVDDHDNPALLRRASDGKLLAGFTTHVNDPYINISTNADDATAWAGPTNLSATFGETDLLGYTYCHLVQLEGEANDPIYFFGRRHTAAGIARMYYSKSTDGGVTWATATQVVTLTYHKLARNTDTRIDFALSNHADNATDPGDHSIYHMYYEGGNWHKTDGTQITASLPFAAADLTKVQNGDATTPLWIWDIAIDGTGKPVIVYVSFTSTTNHRYRYAHWTGSVWETHEIMAGGTYIPTESALGNPIEAYYSGGVYLDHNDPTIVYTSVGSGGDRWDLYRNVTADHGTSWTSTQLTNSGKHVRPVTVLNHVDDLQVLDMSGTYASYVNWNTATEGAGIP